MAIYAISDLHLSSTNPKPMDIFSPVWTDHAEKIRRNWGRIVRDEDTVLLPGDLSWAIRFSEAEPDLKLVDDLPGTKILIRGNHDYWWQRRETSRIQRTFDGRMVFLQGTSVMVGDIGITGTRGWRVEREYQGLSTGEPAGPQSETREQKPNKILERELAYLERGLQSIPKSARMKIAMLHYPPFDERLQPNEFARLLAKYSVDILVYGHVHLGLGSWLGGLVDGVRYHMVSADIVDFIPQLIVS